MTGTTHSNQVDAWNEHGADHGRQADRASSVTWHHEVLVVGAGPAGLGAAMALARLGRSVLVCDDDRPRNAPAAHMHNVAGHEGVSPREWRARARSDVGKYDTTRFFDGAVTDLEQTAGGFIATLSFQRSVRVKKVILADGVEDRPPKIPGLWEHWGGSVFHCPFCHGYEHRGGRLGVIANGPQAMHGLSLLSGLTTDLMLFTHGASELSAEQHEMLRRKHIEVVEGLIERVVDVNGALRGLHVEGRLIERTGLLVMGPKLYHLKSKLGQLLGCERAENGLYRVGEGNRTSVPGVYAAGDNMNGLHSVVAASASGQVAGASAVRDLLEESFRS